MLTNYFKTEDVTRFVKVIDEVFETIRLINVDLKNVLADQGVKNFDQHLLDNVVKEDASLISDPEFVLYDLSDPKNRTVGTPVRGLIKIDEKGLKVFRKKLYEILPKLKHTDSLTFEDGICTLTPKNLEALLVSL